MFASVDSGGVRDGVEEERLGDESEFIDTPSCFVYYFSSTIFVEYFLVTDLINCGRGVADRLRSFGRQKAPGLRMTNRVWRAS